MTVRGQDRDAALVAAFLAQGGKIQQLSERETSGMDWRPAWTKAVPFKGNEQEAERIARREAAAGRGAR